MWVGTTFDYANEFLLAILPPSVRCPALLRRALPLHQHTQLLRPAASIATPYAHIASNVWACAHVRWPGMHALLTIAHDRIQEIWQILRNLDVMSGLVEGLSGLVSRWASSSYLERAGVFRRNK